jgi:hypothetical protein
LGPVKDVVPAEIVSAPAARSGESGIPPEPIAKAVRDGWGKTLHWWRHSNLTAPAKLALLGVAVLVLIFNSNWLMPLAVTFGCLYLIYFGVRSLVLVFQGGSAQTVPVATAAVVAAPAVARERPNRCLRRRKWREEARARLSNKSYGECLGEVCGSLLMSAFVVAVASLLMLMVAGKPLDASVYTWTFYAWFSLTSLAGAWLVLTLGKCWESREGEPFRRRFVMLIGGLLVGLLAFGVADFLGVRLTDDLVVRGLPTRLVSANLYQADGTLKLPAYLVYFGLLFVLLRWWTQADPLRTSRLSVWCLGVCALGAWILHLLWPFPQPWGFMLAATTSLAVQLSSPWLSSRERSEIREQVQQG